LGGGFFWSHPPSFVGVGGGGGVCHLAGRRGDWPPHPHPLSHKGRGGYASTHARQVRILGAVPPRYAAGGGARGDGTGCRRRGVRCLGRFPEIRVGKLAFGCRCSIMGRPTGDGVRFLSAKAGARNTQWVFRSSRVLGSRLLRVLCASPSDHAVAPGTFGFEKERCLSEQCLFAAGSQAFGPTAVPGGRGAGGTYRALFGRGASDHPPAKCST